jgi:drug/metabolite transporter (DMT)-like permease
MDKTAATRSNPALILPHLALLVGILSLGFSGILVRWADAPGPITSFYRMGIAAVVLAWPFFRHVASTPHLPRRGFLLAALGGLFLGTDMALWATGVTMSGATNPTLLANTAPLWVGLGSLILFGEKLPRVFWFGLALAMIGATLIVGPDNLRSESLGLGSIFGLLAAVFYGGYFLITQRGREMLDPLTYLWPVTASATVGLFLLNLALGYPFTGYSGLTYLNFLAMGLVPQILGYLALNYALGYLPASAVSPTMLGQPVMTALLAWWLLDETLSPQQLLGGAAVLIGVYVVHASRRKRSAPPLTKADAAPPRPRRDPTKPPAP